MEIKRTDILNYLIETKGFKSFLEIGVQNGVNNRCIKCQRIVGVDPYQPRRFKGEFHKKTSDEFFKNNTEKFDLIFIDGDHSYEQSKKDLQNALNHLSVKGLVAMHDANPMSLKYIALDLCGEVYKTVMWAQNEGYDVRTVEEDHGVAIVYPERLPFLENYDLEMDQEEFLKNKREILNMVTFEEFKQNGVVKKISYADMTDDDIKKLYFEKFGKKPRGKFNRERIIEKIIG